MFKIYGVWLIQQLIIKQMEYRKLGRSGLLVSRISFGNMVNFQPQDEEVNVEIIKKALEAGINFFDTAEFYGNGEAERALGNAFKKLNVPREKLVVSTKIIGRAENVGNQINRRSTLSRKHVLEGVETSLKNLQLDYVDVIFAHSFDPNTTMEEVCRGFNQVIENGQAFYWATSNWNATQIQEAFNVCDRLGLHRPIAEQCQYNMIHRQQFEVEYGPLQKVQKNNRFDKHGYGTTIWSPLAQGILTGKYNETVTEDQKCRLNEGLPFAPKQVLKTLFFDKFLGANQSKLRVLGDLAKELGVSQAALSLAWALKNNDVTTAIIGARNVKQLEDTLTSLEAFKKLTPAIEARIEEILANRPTSGFNAIKWEQFPSRR